jgi:hypothetical protein
MHYEELKYGKRKTVKDPELKAIRLIRCSCKAVKPQFPSERG